MRKIISILFAVMVFTGTGLLAQETGSDSGEDIRVRRIVILPFDNYAGSGMKYLEYYIPELMKDNLELKKEIEVLDAADIEEILMVQELDSSDFRDIDNVTRFLSMIDAEMGITGRYIIHDTTIKIDVKVVYVTGRVLDAKTWEGTVDERFLSSMDKFAQNSDLWIKNYVLGYSVKGMFDESNVFTRIFMRIRESKAGFLITNKWIFAVIIVVFFYVISLFLLLFMEKVVKRITSRTETDVDDRIIAISKKPLRWIVTLIGIRLAVITLGLGSTATEILDNIVIALIILLATYIATGTVGEMIHEWGRRIAERIDSRIDDDLVPLFVNISKIVLVSIGLLMILSRFGIDIAPLIASLGIAGFAIGFAVKDSLSNIIGGIVLILDHSFAVGDKVMIDGDLGVIKEVGLRNTMLMTYDNEIIVIPNGELMNKKFKNYVLPDPKIRVQVKFGVAYGSNIDRVQDIVIEAVKNMDDVLEEPAPMVIFEEMGDFSLNMKAICWVDEYTNQWAKWLELTKLVYKTLQDNGISIPFPTQTVYLEKDEG